MLYNIRYYNRSINHGCFEVFSLKRENLASSIVYYLYRVWAESVSASYRLASYSGKRNDGHLHPDCVPKGAMCRYYRLRMTERIELPHRDSLGTDTWHTSKSRWSALLLPSGIPDRKRPGSSLKT